MSLSWDNWPHVLRMQQFSPEILEEIITHAISFENAMVADTRLPRRSKVRRQRRDGSKVRRSLRSLFYQPSTRTEGTFITAAHHLGCGVHAVKDPSAFSGSAKGESNMLATMAYTAAGGLGHLRGCDGIIMRHPHEGAVQEAADVIEAALGDVWHEHPLFVINGGDGKFGQHPTQTITDLTTIAIRRGSARKLLNNLTIFFPGDIRRSRVIRSMLYACGQYGGDCGMRVIFSCPPGLGPMDDILLYLSRHKVVYEFIAPGEVEDVVPEVDIWYSTRDQREYDNDEEVIIDHMRKCFVFRKEYFSKLKDGALVMHPLPINEDKNDPPAEIDPELIPLAIGGDSRLPFCQNSQRHIPTRAALLDLIFEGLDEKNGNT